MNLNNLLNQVLNSVSQSGGNRRQTPQSSGGNLLGQIGGGALAAGVASMLLKKKNTQSLLKAGSLAALGMLAYKAYQNRQNSADAPALPAQAEFEPAGQQAEDHSRIILRTMIAAAASDGLIDETEKQIITQESGQDDAELQRWLAAEYANPADTADIARAIGSNRALAAEAYLAARVVCGDLARKEIVFLARLAQDLNLDEQLVESLESQLEI